MPALIVKNRDFLISDIECSLKLKDEFNKWFGGLVTAGHESCVPSCFWRDILRSNRRNLFLKFLEQSNADFKPVKG